MQERILESFIIGDSKNEISLRPSAPSQQLLPSRFNVFNASTIVFGRFPSPSPLPRGFSGHVARPSRSIQRFNESRPRSDSSLLGQCLRLVSYATGTLSRLRLRAFNRRSSLPSLCYCIA